MADEIHKHSPSWMDAMRLCEERHFNRKNYPCCECLKSIDKALQEELDEIAYNPNN